MNTLAQLPLAFEPNHGQAAAAVEFQTRAPGYLLQLAPAGMRLVVKGARGPRGTPARAAAVTMTWNGANPHAAARAEAMLPGTVNYLKGAGPEAWHTGIPTYERVRYDALYPGIDVVYYGNGRQLEYDLIVAPGADPHAARLVLHGADVRRGDHGGLDVAVSQEQVLHLRAPVAYQDRNGERRQVEAHYRVSQVAGAAEIAFDLGAYDPERPLVIDPIVYSTLLGGSAADVGFAIAVNAAGDAFVVGSTADGAADFPVTAGAFDTAIDDEDVFVTRVNSTGTALVYSTYLGGSSFDRGFGIAVNAANEAFVTGTTANAATNFPVTAGAFDTVHGGNEDAFVTRLNASGTALIYSTLLGGVGYERGNAVALNAAGEAFVTGAATFANMNGFPVTVGAFDPAHNGRSDAFVTRVNATGSALVYSTFLGGSHDDTGLGIAVNAVNEAFVTGETFDAATDFPVTPGSVDPTHNTGFDVFVTKLNGAGSALVYSTFLGGSDNDSGYAVAINAAGEAFVTGRTGNAANLFPVTAGAYDVTHNGGYDAYVARLNSAGSALVYATFVGGGLSDHGRAIAVIAGDRALVSGFTEDAVVDFPTTAGAVATTHGGATDAFVSVVNASGSALDDSTFLGGNGLDVSYGLAAGPGGEAFVTGETYFDEMAGPVMFPTTAGAFDTTYNGGNSD
ncbi:MAG: hypothetical protein IT181_09110, partial [Acidobacteria bacterium]|nr:hypothetical protein [Acidobacteriota bacterium]